MNGSDSLVKILLQDGVDRVFANPVVPAPKATTVRVQNLRSSGRMWLVSAFSDLGCHRAKDRSELIPTARQCARLSG